MNALMAKYFRRSLLAHGLLLLALIFPALVRCRKPTPRHELVTYIDLASLPEPPAEAVPAEPSPPAPEPAPPPPAPAPPRTNRPPRQIEVSRERVRRPVDTPRPIPQPAAPTAEEIRRALERDLVPATPGTAGITPLQRYERQIHPILYRAWEQPVGLRPGLRARVRLRVARDGRILEWTLIAPSGIESMDRSVQQVRNAVPHLPPLPEGVRGNHADIEVIFDLE